MFAKFAGFNRHSDLIAVLSAMLIVLALVARAPLPDTGNGWRLTATDTCAPHTVCTGVTTGA